MQPPILPTSSLQNPAATGGPHFQVNAGSKKRRLDDAKPENNSLSLDNLPLQLHQAIAVDCPETQRIAALCDINARLTNALWSGYFKTSESAPVQCKHQCNRIADQNFGLNQSSLLPTVESALQQKKSRITHDGSLTVIATPVLNTNGNKTDCKECFCVALNLGKEPAEPFLLVVQLVATTLASWRTSTDVQKLDWQIDSTAAIAELMSKIVNTHGRKNAANKAANEMATFLQSPLVAIGYVHHPNSKRVRLQTISGVADLDAGGKQTRQLQSLLSETLVRESVSTTPTIGDDDRSFKLAHQKLLESHPNNRIVSSPLKTSAGITIGAWVCLLPDNETHHQRLCRFAQVTSHYLADALHANQQASLGAATRFAKQSVRFFGGKVGRMLLLAAAAFVLVMLIPVPHRVDCGCQLKPTVRRFAVAPHDGILQESMVEPGDLVTAGQVIARMDDRELGMELTGLIAELEAAEKKRDVSRSSRDAAATQIAELEIEQLQAQIELVQFKKDNLEIKSLIDGIVLQGELDDAKGAPVRTGDVLMEISPLDEMRLEVNVPESDIHFVRVQQQMTFVLEGSPFEARQGEIVQIHPESEVRDSRNVFVSEVKVDNSQQLLRPGLQGRAKIAAGWKSLGWVLFHKPAERVYKIFR